MVSLTLYNRRQRTLWIEKEVENLNQARIAQASGTATEEQLEMIKKEEIAEIVKRKREEEKAQRPWAKAKRFLFDKMNTEDAGATAAQASAAMSTSVAAEKADVSRPGVADAAQAKQAFDAASAKTGSPMPGQLDVMAENAERAAKQTTRSWTSWLTGR